MNNIIQAELAPIREKRQMLQKDIPYVYEVLKKGSEEAREVAARTLDEVKAAMKINYFDNDALIQASIDKYSN